MLERFDQIDKELKARNDVRRYHQTEMKAMNDALHRDRSHEKDLMTQTVRHLDR